MSEQQVLPPSEHVLFEGMARVYDKTEADEYIASLHASLAQSEAERERLKETNERQKEGWRTDVEGLGLRVNMYAKERDGALAELASSQEALRAAQKELAFIKGIAKGPEILADLRERMQQAVEKLDDWIRRWQPTDRRALLEAISLLSSGESNR